MASNLTGINLGSGITVQNKGCSSIQPMLDAGNQDIFLQMELFFASSAAEASLNAVEVMKRAKASRAINDGKKAYQGLGIADKDNTFRYDKDKTEFIDTWLGKYTMENPSKDPAEVNRNPTVPRPNTIPQFTQEQVNTMLSLEKSILKGQGGDGILSAEEKASLDNLILPTFKTDDNGQEVLSDEIMTVMLQQANALLQNWLSGFQKISTARVETLKEFIRALT